MSLVEEILKNLWTTTLNYKGVRVNMFGIPQFRNYSPGTVRSTLYRIHKRGWVAKSNKGWNLTTAGRKYMRRKADSLINFDFKFVKSAPKDLIVMFDIPETRKAEREWFRWHLKKLNYVMIQKSVWVGPSPLPKDFLEYIEKIKLRKEVKTFKLAGAYNFNKS